MTWRCIGHDVCASARLGVVGCKIKTSRCRVECEGMRMRAAGRKKLEVAEGKRGTDATAAARTWEIRWGSVHASREQGIAMHNKRSSYFPCCVLRCALGVEDFGSGGDEFTASRVRAWGRNDYAQRATAGGKYSPGALHGAWTRPDLSSLSRESHPVSRQTPLNHAGVPHVSSDLLVIICCDRIPYRTVYSRTVYAPIRRQRWAGQPPSHQSLVAAIKDGRRHRIPRSPTPAINAIKCPAARAQLARSGLKN
ncbi:hypothetical protein DFH09DRAFT_1103088 [Mycena vulgaris]|nr:hypothetical protein DFH09DRAFT_1103088 [Mycena vulgaris]